MCVFFFCLAELRKRLFADSSVTPNTWLRTNEGGIKTFDCLRKEVGDILRFVCMHKYVCVRVLLCDLFHLTPHPAPTTLFTLFSHSRQESHCTLISLFNSLFSRSLSPFISLPCNHFLSETFSKRQTFTSKPIIVAWLIFIFIYITFCNISLYFNLSGWSRFRKSQIL